jgi:hypothetical protein
MDGTRLISTLSVEKWAKARIQKGEKQQLHCQTAAKACSTIMPTMSQGALKTDTIARYRRGQRWPNNGSLNPMWCEWLMGFPANWTE